MPRVRRLRDDEIRTKAQRLGAEIYDAGDAARFQQRQAPQKQGGRCAAFLKAKAEEKRRRRKDKRRSLMRRTPHPAAPQPPSPARGEG